MLTGAELTQYAKLVGSLLWVAQGTRPDIAYITSHLARFMSCPTDAHFADALRVVQWLNQTRDHGLVYTAKQGAVLTGWADADHAADQASRRSISAYIFQHHGDTISWHSKLQSSVATSSVHAEYVALSTAATEALFLRQMLEELKVTLPRATQIFTDSSGAEAISKNLTFSNKTKGIETHYHHVRERHERQEIQVTKIDGAQNPADYLTKGKSGSAVNKFNVMLGLGPKPDTIQGGESKGNQS